MINKVSQHFNKGMNRDLSDSKVSNEFVYENYNIRITENDGDTLLSATNERGNKEAELYELNNDSLVLTSIKGKYCGHCVIDKYIVLFTQDDNINYIYRINLNDDNTLISKELYHGDLNISSDYPLECIGDYQTENIIKVYWIDSINQPRVINILDEKTNYNDDYFDFAIKLNTTYKLEVSNNYNNSGQFPSGVIQYFITGVRNQIESSILAQSDMLSLVNKDRGLSEDETYDYSVNINIIKESDTNIFDRYILYSIQRVSENTEPISRKVKEIDVNSFDNIIDFGNIGESISASDLLYKGSDRISAETIDTKDNVLFLGNINLKTTKMSDDLIKMVKDKNQYSVNCSHKIINFDQNSDLYYNKPYLRSGNYYRIGIQFKDKYGKWTSAFYIEDFLVNLNSIIEDKTAYIPSVTIDLAQPLIDSLLAEDFITARALIVLPNENERVVIAQGVLNQNVINISDRNSGAGYTDSSWFWRPIHADIVEDSDQEFRPYYPLKFANSLGAEIQSQNKEDYDYAIETRSRDLNQYIIDSTIQDFYSPDIYNYFNKTISKDIVNCNIIGACELAKEIQYDTNTFVDTPIGILPSITTVNNIHSKDKGIDYYNVKPGFLDMYANRNTLAPSSQVKGIPSEVMEKIGVGFVFATYPWHRDSSLNNDIPTENRTALLKNKIMSKYLSFNSYLNNDIRTELELNDDIYFFDNTIDYIKLKDNNLYRGNLNTLVSPKKYASPIYIIRFKNNNKITWDDIKLSDGADSGQISTPFYRANIIDEPYTKLKAFGIGVESSYGSGDYEYERELPDFSNIADKYKDVYHLEMTTEVSTMDPVSIKYKTCNHFILNFKNAPFIEDWYDEDNYQYKGMELSGDYIWGQRPSEEDSRMFKYIPVKNPNNKQLFIVNISRKNIDKKNIFGGQNDYAYENNNWLVASEEFDLNKNWIDLNIGDTYLGRWDILKTFQYTNEDKNSVVEIGSFILETYNNPIGRYDSNRDSNDYSFMNEQNFNLYNDVYNQKNNFLNYRYLRDEFLETNIFKNQFIWTLEHTPGATIDQWTNITYGSFYNVDGRNGEIRAIRKFRDTLIGFQDSGIFEILFNSRSQISMQNGVPIELGNSGKVDGIRYLTNNVGCINKWSIVETPNGLYFIDDLNYSINRFNGQLESLSDEQGFAQWCKENIIPYEKWNINNKGFRSYYDRIQNDVYFSNEYNSLVFSEKLNQFMSFIDYPSNQVMFNLNDKFISFNNKFWFNREGEFNSFFDEYKDYYIKYRIAPDPYINKTFNNIEYITTSDNMYSNYTDLFVNGVNQEGHNDLTKRDKLPPFNLQKKFNIWRANIPRDETNILNRIQSPWIYMTLMSDANKRKTNDKVELHNMLVKYSV